MRQHEPLEHRARKPAEFRVAQGDQGGGARSAGNQRHLTGGFAGHDAPDQAPMPFGRLRVGAEAAADDQVERIGRIARLEERRAAGQCEPLNFVHDGVEQRIIEALKQRECAHEPGRAPIEIPRLAVWIAL